ncbi:MAG: radical SAM protein [Treponema sp.]|nr:radical SAM protein [Treponema sp.]
MAIDNVARLRKKASLLRGPIQIQFDLTTTCNFRCLHCYNASGENNIVKDELTDVEIMKLFSDFKHLQPFNLCFCGGEPLLRLDVMLKASSLIKSVVPNISMVTNGYLLKKDTLEALIHSGINRIQISLDGNTKESHEMLRNAKGSYEKAIEAIELCLEYKDKLKEINICFIPTRFNIQEFHELSVRMLGKGVNIMRTQPLMLIGRAKDFHKKLMPTHFQYRTLIKTVISLQETYGQRRVQYGDPVDHIIRFRSHLSNLFHQLCLRANGDIVTSMYFPIVAGNVRKHSIIDYWEKGLVFIWNNEVVSDYARNINCIFDLGRHINGYPNLWQETDIDIDILG